MWPNPVLQASLRREQEMYTASKDFARDNAKRIKQMAAER